MIPDTEYSSVESLLQALRKVEQERDDLKLETESLKTELSAIKDTLSQELTCTKGLLVALSKAQQDSETLQEKLELILNTDSTKRGIRFMQLHSEGQEFFKANLPLSGKVLMHIANKCTREGWFADTLQEVAEALNDDKGNISKAIKTLTKSTVGSNPPLKRISTGRGYVYALNPNYIWHGKVDCMYTTSAYNICKRIESGEVDGARIMVTLKAYKDENNTSGLKDINKILTEKPKLDS